MVTTLAEAEEYLQGLEAKPFGYKNERPSAEDFIKMRETLRWAVDTLNNLQERLEEESL